MGLRTKAAKGEPTTLSKDMGIYFSSPTLTGSGLSYGGYPGLYTSSSTAGATTTISSTAGATTTITGTVTWGPPTEPWIAPAGGWLPASSFIMEPPKVSKAVLEAIVRDLIHQAHPEAV